MTCNLIILCKIGRLEVMFTYCKCKTLCEKFLINISAHGRHFACVYVLLVASAQVNLFKDTDKLQLHGTPPLIRYFPFFTSHLWFLGRSASSCTQLPPRLLFLAPHPKVLQPFCSPLKEKEGHQKAFAVLCRHEHRWTFLVSLTASEVVVSKERWGVGCSVEVSDPLWPFVYKRDRGPSPFPTQRALRLMLSYWSPSSRHVPLLLPLPHISFSVIPYHAICCQPDTNRCCLSDLDSLKTLYCIFRSLHLPRL